MALLEIGVHGFVPVEARPKSSALESLKVVHSDSQFEGWYYAGLPGFPRIFFRDLMKTARMSEDAYMMYHALRLGATRQGKKNNPDTHEQPGSIFHEIDPATNEGFRIPQRGNLSTEYAACDTTAEFLIGHMDYIRKTGDNRLATVQKPNIIAAAENIIRHINPKGLHTESPEYSGAKGLALPVNYWRDSEIPDRVDGVPVYPITFTLAHIINMMGMRNAGRLMQGFGELDLARRYGETAGDMHAALQELYSSERKTFDIARDTHGTVGGYSTDVLHALSYIEPGDFSREQIMDIVESSQILEADLGYRILDKEMAGKVADPYHAVTVWTHDQAEIFLGAKKHLLSAERHGDRSLVKRLKHVMDISSRVYTRYLVKNPESFPELFDADSSDPRGCDPQLWAKGAAERFAHELRAA